MRANRIAYAMALLVLLTSTGEAATGDKRTQLLNQLVVELDPSRLGKSVSEYARDAANGDFHALSSLGSPKSVSPLIPHRIADDEIKQLDPKSPEYRLQNMLLLDFSSEFETNEAAMALARNSNVVNIEQTVLGKYLADPLIPIVAQKPKYQWGLYSLNVITSTDPVGVWAKTRGSAYVAALDNGIYTTPSVHEDLAANYRPQLSYNYGAATNGDSGLPTTTNNLHETDAPTDFPAGHGTHVAGLIAAWNGNGLGGSGVCPSCSLMLGRVTTMAEPWPGYFSPEPNFTYVAAAVDGLSRHGAQVINMSFGPPESTVTQQLDATRTAIASAVARDVFLVGASGNAQYDLVDFPASIADHVTAVGGIGSNDRAWEGSGGFGSNWSRTFQVQQFVAPADTVISTIYPAREWNANYACGDSFPSGFMAGYGDCTGTSMAAPHVAGVVALMRSVDPLKSRTQIRDILAATTPVDGTNNTCAGTSKVICQLGRPDAVAAVSGALGGTNVINRKTPLFSFYSTTALDHFYTVVPQMSMAALNQGALWPQPAAATAVAYGPIGSSISQYTAFPQSNCSPTPCSATPKAIAVVYTTHKDPLGGADLVPLYRLSYRCGDELLTSPPNAPNPICATTPRHLSHFYTTDEFAIRLYTGRYLNGVSDPSNPGIGYKLDGIEGFIYSNSVGQPSGTKKLCRKYDGARDDYVLFVGAGASGTDCSATTDGFSGGNYNQLVGGTDWIGWVFPATTSLGPTPSNNLPTITITSPSNGATFGGGTNVPISATAADSGGSIAEVRFFVEQRRVGTDTSSPYSASSGALSPGTYRIRALAIDNQKGVTASSTVTITITGFPSILDAGFESPFVGANNYAAAPPGNNWHMVPAWPGGQSGISGNNSLFTAGTANAPQGSQVAFIQGENTIDQTINFGTAGNYRLQFMAIQRVSNQNTLDLEVYVDGNMLLPRIRPYGSAYKTFQSEVFTVPVGSHNVKLRGYNPFGTDNTIFLDALSIVAP